MATAVELVRRRFTVDEYQQMAEAGILNRGDRVELIRGEIVHMIAAGHDHASCLSRLTHLLFERLQRRAVLWRYAEAGIREYWIVDLAGDAIEVFREPGPNGFHRTDRVPRGGTLTALAFPDTPLAAADVLG